MDLVSGPLRKCALNLIHRRLCLPIGDVEIYLNDLIGARVRLQLKARLPAYTADVKLKKVLVRDFAIRVSNRSRSGDSCIVSPEKCHLIKVLAASLNGPRSIACSRTCLSGEFVGVKVGITRGTQIPTRWIDQGAVQALPIWACRRGSNRFGRDDVQSACRDKTNWRAMLKGQVDTVDLIAERDRLLAACAQPLADLQQRFGVQAIQLLPSAEAITIDYPVREYPVKIVSLDLERRRRSMLAYSASKASI